RHVPGRTRASGVRYRRDRLPAGAACPRGERIHRAGRGRAAPALARGPDRGARVVGLPPGRCEGGIVSAVTVAELTTALAGTPGEVWLTGVLSRVADEPTAIAGLFPAVSRHCGRGPLPGLAGWTTDDAARVLLLAALPVRGEELAAEVRQLYRY